MASTHKHIRSSTANKRPTTAIADGQIALNANATSPGLFFKDSTGASIIKIGPVHVGSTAPNATPGAGGSAGNSTGEVWLDNSLTPVGVKIWNGSAWVNATPAGSTTVQGLLELATSAETQAGSDTDRAVTPAGLQSKVSDSTSTTSSTTIASSTAVKSAYDLANAALPKSGGTITGNLEIGTTGSLSFEGSTADAFETTIAVTDPTADRTITLPDTTGTIVTTGDTGTVTSTMIADGTIVNADVNASAAIAHSKLANITAGQVLLGNASNVPTATALSGDVTVDSSGVTAISSGVIVNADVNASAAIDFSKLASLASANILIGNASNVATSTAVTGDVTISNAGVTAIAAGAIVDADINASAEIAVSKLADGTARQLLQTDAAGTGVEWASNIDIPGTLDVTSAATFDSTIGASAGTASLPSITFTGDLNTGIYSPGADQVAISTNGTGRLFVDSSGNVGVGTTSPGYLLDVASSVAQVGNSTDAFIQYKSTAGNWHVGANSSNAYVFYSGTYGSGTERARIDSSGRLLVGTSSAQGDYTLQVQGDASGATAAGCIYLRRGLNTAAIGANVGADLGKIQFGANDGTVAARIQCLSDATWGSTSDTPGALTFSTTADGASSPTERMRIPNGGGLSVGTTVSPNAVNQQAAIRIGALNFSLTTITNLSTTWTDITAAAGANGLAFIDIYATGSGAQGNFLVSWRGYPANATVISSNNGTGLTINFGVSGGKLQMQTTSGTVSGGAYVWAG